MRLDEQVRAAIGVLEPGKFEQFCCDLLPRMYPEFQGIVGTFNFLGRPTKGPVDAYVRLENGQYVAFVFSTQQRDMTKKIAEDIEKVATRSEIGGDVVEVVACINTPDHGGNARRYEEHAQRYDWRFRLLELHALTRATIEYPEVCAGFLGIKVPEPRDHGTEAMRFYDCGHRVKRVREDLGLTRSQLIELLDLRSEKHLIEIEDRVAECSSATLVQLTEITGVSQEWLRHEVGRPYPVQNARLEAAADTLVELEPERVYVCLETERFVLLFVARVTEHRWAVVDPGFSLDLWEWIDDHRYFPVIYKLLARVMQDFYPSPHGRFLPEQIMTELHAGRMYPKLAVEGRASRLAPDGGMYWVEDVLDVRHRSAVAPAYGKSYGPWFKKLQDKFRQAL